MVPEGIEAARPVEFMKEMGHLSEKLEYYPVLKGHCYLRISKGRYLVGNFRSGGSESVKQEDFLLLSLCRGELTLEQIIKVYGGIFSLPGLSAGESVWETLKHYAEGICFSKTAKQDRRIFPMKYVRGDWKHSVLREEYPHKLTISLTKRCNHKCSYCFNSSGIAGKKEVDIETWRGVISQARELGVQEITFSGGEPFLYRDFLPLAEYCCSVGIYVKISTNGTFLSEDIVERLCRAGVEYIHLSLPAVTEPAYSSITAGGGDLEKVKEAIRCLKRWNFYIRAKMVITPSNAGEAGKLLDFCAQEGIDFVHLAPFILTEDSRGGRALIPGKELLDNVKAVADEKRRQYLQMKIGGPPTDGLRWEGPQAIAKCGGVKDSLTILSDGKVTFCEALGEMEEFVFGNIYENTLEELWDSDIPDAITDIAGKRLDPICQECRYLNCCKTGCFVFSHIQSGNAWSADPRCWKVPASGNIFSVPDGKEDANGTI